MTAKPGSCSPATAASRFDLLTSEIVSLLLCCGDGRKTFAAEGPAATGWWETSSHTNETIRE
jgi:hypothetical protein